MNNETLKQRLINIGFRDTPFRKQIINEVKEWLQQKQKYYKVARYDKAIIDEFLEELKR